MATKIGRNRRLIALARVVGAGLVAASFLAGVTASGAEPKKAEGLPSSAELAPNPSNPNGFLYKRPGVDFRKYDKFLFTGVTVYTGKDAGFTGLSEGDKRVLADDLLAQFSMAVSSGYGVVTEPGPGVARLNLTLVGAEANTPVLSVVTRLVPAGIAINALNSAAKRQGTFMGSATYAVEFYDSQSGELIAAALEKRSPNAMDVTASLESLDAARAAIREGAANLKRAIDSVHAGK